LPNSLRGSAWIVTSGTKVSPQRLRRSMIVVDG
jgi:hypothetical protein